MDPFIESQIWEDFHHALIEVIRESLIPHTRPRYVVRVEERVYVEHILLCVRLSGTATVSGRSLCVVSASAATPCACTISRD
jgi:hypothetical protein